MAANALGLMFEQYRCSLQLLTAVISVINIASTRLCFHKSATFDRAKDREACILYCQCTVTLSSSRSVKMFCFTMMHTDNFPPNTACPN